MNLWLLTQALNVALIMGAKTFSVNQLEIFLHVCVCVNIFCSKTTEGGSFAERFRFFRLLFFLHEHHMILLAKLVFVHFILLLIKPKQ